MPPYIEVVPMQAFWCLQCRWPDACHGRCGTFDHTCEVWSDAQLSGISVFEMVILIQLLIKSEAGLEW